MSLSVNNHAEERPARGSVSEPEITDTSSIGWEIVERVQPIEMIDLELSNLLRTRETNIHGDPPAAIVFLAHSPPCQYAGT